MRAPCFLTYPEWRDIAFDKTGLSFDDCVYTDILVAMANFPALLKELKELDALAVPPMNDLLSYDFNVSDTSSSTYTEVSSSAYTDAPSSTYTDASSSTYTALDSSDDFDPNLEFLTSSFPSDIAQQHSNARIALLDKLHQLKDNLSGLGTHLDAKLADGSAAIELPAIDRDSPVSTAFHFANWHVTVAYNCYWALLILANKITMQLVGPYDTTHYALETECRAVALQICKTWEDAWASRPIGAFHVGLSFVVAYEFCTNDVKEWILRGLNALLDAQHVETFRWSDEVIKLMSGKLAVSASP
jgi:hypothetical protein